MSDLKYSSDNVNTFLKAFQEYNSSKMKYINELDNYTTNLDKVVLNHKKVKATNNSSDFNKKIRFFLLPKGGCKTFKINGTIY